MILDSNSLANTLDNILQEYDVVGDFIYMSQFLDKDGEEKIFTHLQKIRKDSFLLNDRIVFIQDCCDQYSFDTSNDTPGDFLSLIQIYLQKIDITNCFVTIVSSNPDIETELLSANKKYSDTDNTQINFIQLPGSYTKQIIEQDTYCSIMWKGMYLLPHAEITPCCFSDSSYTLGDLKNQSLTEVLNSDVAKKIRTNMLTGKKSPGCHACYHNEKHGKESPRIRFNKQFPLTKEQAEKITTPDGEFKDKNIKFDFLQLSLDSTCNLKCRSCSGRSSSLIAYEEAELYGLTHNKDKILTTKTKNQIVEELKPYVINAKLVQFVGGEPTILKEHYELLDYILENNKQKDIEIYSSINGTSLTYKNRSILDYWNKFDKVQVTVSIDGYDKAFEYLRHGANWQTVQQNIQKIKTFCPHINLGIHSVVSSLSIESTIELQKNWHTSKLASADMFSLSLIQGHDGIYDVQTLPSHHKKRLQYIIDDHVNWLVGINQFELAENWKQISNYMISVDKSHKLCHAKKNIEQIDAKRNENFYQVFPQLSDMFDNIIAIAH